MANAQNPENSRRGFAAMDREKQRQIASMGGKAAHAKGAAHEFTSAEAREAGRKGGLNSHGRKNAANAANAANAENTAHAPGSTVVGGAPAQPQMHQEASAPASVSAQAPDSAHVESSASHASQPQQSDQQNRQSV